MGRNSMNLDNDTLSSIFVLLVVLAIVAVVQFAKGRKLNLTLISFTASAMEKILKPKDKIYQWIGLYVGYKAVYKLEVDSLERLEATLLLLPRQSLLYYPISLIVSRFDRIFLVFCYKKNIPREAHVIRKGYYRKRIDKVIRNANKMMRTRTTIKDKTFYLVYQDANTVNKLLKFIESLEDPSIINHVALVPRNNTLYIAAKVKPQNFQELVAKSYDLAKMMAKEKL